MRLINVDTYELHEFFSENTPQYAILSHTWNEEELTLQHMNQLDPAVKAMKGFGKIAYTCSQARRDGLSWAWVDTCCIDKTSSAELSEAINSMFRWYSESRLCYVYLIDLPDLALTPGHPPSYDNLAQCRWFTRGWCLQELLAPTDVIFFSQGWQHAGYLQDMVPSIAKITGIPGPYLTHQKQLGQASIAARMSWAANRQCSRIEDVAYSLLGLFDVNMPLLYGEGRKAFVRLQEEIWKETDDHSLLAWCVPACDPRAWKRTSVLAESPCDFRRSSRVIPTRRETRLPSAMTKRGLTLFGPIHRLIFPFATVEVAHELVLNCAEVGDDGEVDGVAAKHISILVATTLISPSPDTFTRVATPSHFFESSFNSLREMHCWPWERSIRTSVKSRMIYVQKRLDIADRSTRPKRLLAPQNHALVRLNGLEWYQARSLLHHSPPKNLWYPWCPIIGSEWLNIMETTLPARDCSHWVVPLGELSEIVYTTAGLTVLRMAGDDRSIDGSRCMQLLLISRKKRWGKRVGMSVELRCGIKFEEESRTPMACIALLPWDDDAKRLTATGPLDAKQYRERLRQHNAELLEWTQQNLQPPRSGSQTLATASTWLERYQGNQATLSVEMRLLDAEMAGDPLFRSSPRLELLFSHSS